MTLFKQMFLGVSILFFVLLAGVEAIYLANARLHLRSMLASTAQDAATTLALRLGALPELDDRGLVELIVSPVFDRGHFQEIRVFSTGGEPLVSKVLAPASEPGAPEWFIRAFPLGAPGAQSLVSSGWRELGRVAVTSHPHFAYLQLWETGLHTTAWLLLVYFAAIAAIMGFLGMLLRPLKEIERFARAISERDFRSITLVPSARELASVVVALNGMSGKIKQALAEESVRAEALRSDAFVDPTTLLFNRRGFKLELQALTESRQDVFSGALAIVEIQNFGALNTHVGYQRGDEVLALLGGVLSAACAEHAAVCGRLHGAGFVFAAINIDAGALQQLVAAVCARFGSVLAAQGTGVELRCHCGATRHEGALPPFSTLLAAADMALERARAKGDNEYDIELLDDAAVDGSQVWRARIEGALDRNQIALFAQDVFGFPERTPVHGEVTARIIGEDGEPVPAARFLPMALRYGLIARLDCSVLEKLLAHLAAHLATTATPATMATMALNVSALTIADAEATRRLLALLEARRELAGRLVFEMTEFGASQDVELTQGFSAAVRRLGARFALDNFGAQKDSLMLVHALKPHYIKLSPRYSRELAGNADCRFFVSSIVRIARTLDIGIYAQAVEDAGLVPLLAELGLSGYQGQVSALPVRIA